MMTQKEQVLTHITKYGSITPQDAVMEYNIYRLGARIFDLRAEGYPIRTINETYKNKETGEVKTYARYVLDD